MKSKILIVLIPILVIMLYSTNHALAEMSLAKEFTWDGANLNARMYTFNNYLFISEYLENKVSIFDISDNKNPILVKRLRVDSKPRNCLVNGSYLYVTNVSSNDIQIFDISNIKYPLLINTLFTGDSPRYSMIFNKYLYVVCAGVNTLEKYDISNIESITLEKSVSTSITPLSIDICNGIVAVTGLNSNLDLFNISNLSKISTTAIGGKSHPTCLFKGNNILITDSDLNRLYSVDVSKPLIPIINSYVAISKPPEQVFVKDNYAYIPALTNSGIKSTIDCIDITNMNNLMKTQTLTLNICGAGFLTYNNGFLYISGHFSPYLIEIIDIGEKHIDQPRLTAIPLTNINNANKQRINEILIEINMLINELKKLTQ